MKTKNIHIEVLKKGFIIRAEDKKYEDVAVEYCAKLKDVCKFLKNLK